MVDCPDVSDRNSEDMAFVILFPFFGYNCCYFSFSGVIDYIACNHIRAAYLFMDSINSGECPYLAFHCTREWEDYNEGLCFEDTPTAQMGWLADQYAPDEGVKELVYQQNTLDSAPYCGMNGIKTRKI